MPPPKYTSLPSDVGAVQPMAGIPYMSTALSAFSPPSAVKVHAAIRHEGFQGEVGTTADAGRTGGIGDRSHGAAGIGGDGTGQAFLIGADTDELIAVSGKRTDGNSNRG